MTGISLCCTVRNESASIDRLLQSIAEQTRQPDDIIIVDGGSSDDTVARIDRWRHRLPIKVLVIPGASISGGRNQAIRSAAGPIIAVTDAGVQLDRRWLEALARPIEDGDAEVTAGFFVADPQTTFETAMGATVLPAVGEIDPDRFLPSSRSIAFRKFVWEKVGGYPEWLDYCEDLVFDLAYRSAGFRQHWVPTAIAYFRPRSNLTGFWLQYYRYARGDGKADLWRRRQAARYLTYGLGGPLLLIAGRRWPLAWLMLFLGMIGYLRTPINRYLAVTGGWSTRRRLTGAAWIPVIRIVGDLAKMAGYPVGVRWRLRNRPPL